MKKMCMTCGNTVENMNIKECPNCGSFDLKTVRTESERSNRFRLGK